jgi:glycerol kinase
MTEYVVAIDQGTSSSRAVVFDRGLRAVASAQEPFPQSYPRPGWVEHDPETIWRTTLAVTRKAISDSNVDTDAFAGLGITNQRETTLVWRRDDGRCIYPAMVWQDRRTAAYCRELRERGVEADVSRKTGLRLDPYFSASKLAWILDHVSGARAMAEAGELAFGTVDAFLIWRLTGGRVHATDATNASRTLLFDIHAQRWDEDLLRLFGVPAGMLPDVRDCAGDFGETDASVVGAALPIRGVAGDQQAALIGQAGLDTGMTKSTYGTGSFVIANTGGTVIESRNRLLSTVAYRLDGDVTYGLEGSIFVAGSAIQWIRDELELIATAPDSQAVAESTGVVEHIHVVPAFAGLGAPFWDPDARGGILGLSRDTTGDEIVTATLQAVAYQTRDLMRAMADDGIDPKVLRVDGGMVGNDWLLQFLADILGIDVERPKMVESTVLGAACLAGLASGLIGSTRALADLWQRDALFRPAMDGERRERLYAGWLDAVSRIRTTDR